MPRAFAIFNGFHRALAAFCARSRVVVCGWLCAISLAPSDLIKAFGRCSMTYALVISFPQCWHFMADNHAQHWAVWQLRAASKKHRIPPGEGCETFTLMGSADPRKGIRMSSALRRSMDKRRREPATSAKCTNARLY